MLGSGSKKNDIEHHLIDCFEFIMYGCRDFMLRGAILRIGGFTLSFSTFKGQILTLSQQPMFIIGFILYGSAAVIWFQILSMENLSTSYPLLISITFVLVTLGAVVFFHEQVSWQKILGLGVILVGILMVSHA